MSAYQVRGIKGLIQREGGMQSAQLVGNVRVLLLEFTKFKTDLICLVAIDPTDEISNGFSDVLGVKRLEAEEPGGRGALV